MESNIYSRERHGPKFTLVDVVRCDFEALEYGKDRRWLKQKLPTPFKLE